MSLIHNEQTKLFANALDRASTACLTVGVATPLIAFIYNIGQLRENVPVWWIVAGTFIWFSTAIALHLLARRVLKGLKS